MEKHLESKFISEDVRTVHSEIKQIIGQRYLILTAAITLLGLFLTCLVQYSSHDKINNDLIQGPFIFSILFCFIFLLLNFYLSILSKQLFTLSAFLVALDASVYEKYWGLFPREKLSGYSFAQKICFLIFGFLINIIAFFLVFLQEKEFSLKNILTPLITLTIYISTIEIVKYCIINKKKKRSLIEIWKKVLINN